MNDAKVLEHVKSSMKAILHRGDIDFTMHRFADEFVHSRRVDGKLEFNCSRTYSANRIVWVDLWLDEDKVKEGATIEVSEGFFGVVKGADFIEDGSAEEGRAYIERWDPASGLIKFKFAFSMGEQSVQTGEIELTIGTSRTGKPAPYHITAVLDRGDADETMHGYRAELVNVIKDNGIFKFLSAYTYSQSRIVWLDLWLREDKLKTGAILEVGDDFGGQLQGGGFIESGKAQKGKAVIQTWDPVTGMLKLNFEFSIGEQSVHSGQVERYFDSSKLPAQPECYSPS